LYVLYSRGCRREVEFTISGATERPKSFLHGIAWLVTEEVVFFETHERPSSLAA
jgi:hypothetical protein